MTNKSESIMNNETRKKVVKPSIKNIAFTGCTCNGEYYEKHGFGVYDNQVLIPKPKHMGAGRDEHGRVHTICIDMCLVKEIKWLWDQGITTTGNCCGHNRKNLAGNRGDYIGVIDEDIPRMLELGYETAPGITANRRDSFYTKTVGESILQNEQEGEEVSVYDEFKGVKYGTCNGRSKTKCGSDQKEGTEVCEICGTKLIWPDNEKKGEG